MIISQNSNDVYYAYTRGRFWRWDESARVWKESHLLAQKFGKAKVAEKHLTPEVFLTGNEFIPMDDYELPDRMLTALREAKPCKNAPIDPVEEPEVPGTQTEQDKPLTTVPDEMRPAFDYSGLTDQTVEDLHFAEDEYRHGKQMAERGLVHMGNAIAAAHDALCGVVARCDNGENGACRTMRKARNNQHSEDTFKSWCVSIGITKDTAYRLLQVSALLDGSSPRQQKILKELSPTLLYAVAKPSAPAELVEQVKSGDITTNKQYQEALVQIKAEKDRADAAEAERDKLLGAQNRAAWAESHIQDVEAQRDAALADVQGLTEQNAQLKERADSAEAREEEAWKMQSKAEARAKNAEGQLSGSRQVAEAAKLRADKLQEENAALKKQPIAAVVDEEEVDRRAKALAHQWDEEELDRLAAEKAWGLADARISELAKDNTALRKQLATLQARANDNTQADFETANYCASLFRSAWDTCKGSYSRLTGEDLESTFQTLCGALNSIMEEASLLCRQPADYDGGAADEPDV